MPAIAAIVRKGLRLAISAALTLAVLLAGSGAHPVSHCSDHADDPATMLIASEVGEPDNDDDGLCLNCDCSCQTVYLDEAFAMLLPVSDVLGLVRIDGRMSPDEVVFEVDPPPVRAS